MTIELAKPMVVVVGFSKHESDYYSGKSIDAERSRWQGRVTELESEVHDLQSEIDRCKAEAKEIIDTLTHSLTTANDTNEITWAKLNEAAQLVRDAVIRAEKAEDEAKNWQRKVIEMGIERTALEERIRCLEAALREVRGKCYDACEGCAQDRDGAGCTMHCNHNIDTIKEVVGRVLPQGDEK